MAKYKLYEEQVDRYKKDLIRLKKEFDENTIALNEAFAMGDISENSDLDSAKNLKSVLERQMADINDILFDYEIIEEGVYNEDDDTDVIGNGSVVVLSTNSAPIYSIAVNLVNDYPECRSYIEVDKENKSTRLAVVVGDDSEFLKPLTIMYKGKERSLGSLDLNSGAGVLLKGRSYGDVVVYREDAPTSRLVELKIERL